MILTSALEEKEGQDISVENPAKNPTLRLNSIDVVYDRVILVLKGVSLEVPDGWIVTLLGANGAGKSTTLKAISGLLSAERGEVTQGSIEFRGQRIDRKDAADVVRMGVTQAMEGRRVFEHLTTEENLIAGAHTRSASPPQPRGRTSILGFFARRGSKGDLRTELDKVYSYFPKLTERRQVKAGYLSGGEQQMLAIGRALMAQPKLMLLDEPSLGLAPYLMHEIYGIIVRLNQEEKVTILLVEQNATMALGIAHYGYVMENGRIVLDGTADTLRINEDIKEFYLGLTAVGQLKSYRDIKHYKRRKRWLS